MDKLSLQNSFQSFAKNFEDYFVNINDRLIEMWLKRIGFEKNRGQVGLNLEYIRISSIKMGQAGITWNLDNKLGGQGVSIRVNQEILQG